MLFVSPFSRPMRNTSKTQHISFLSKSHDILSLAIVKSLDMFGVLK